MGDKSLEWDLVKPVSNQQVSDYLTRHVSNAGKEMSTGVSKHMLTYVSADAVGMAVQEWYYWSVHPG